MNSSTFTGNVADAPQRIEFGKEGEKQVLARFRFANNEWVNGKSVQNGFFDAVVFNNQAQHVLDTLQKGDRIVITGYLQHQVYDKPDGTKGATTKLMVEEVGMSLRFQPIIFDRKPRENREDRNLAALVAEVDSQRRAEAAAEPAASATALTPDILGALPVAKLKQLAREAGHDIQGLKKEDLVTLIAGE